jgi:hypothetical protein
VSVPPPGEPAWIQTPAPTPTPTTFAPTQPAPVVQPVPTYQPATAQVPVAPAPAPAPMPPTTAPTRPARPGGSKAGLWAAIVAFVGLAVATGIILASGDDGDPSDDSTTRTVVEQTTTTGEAGTTAPPTTLGFDSPGVRSNFVSSCVADQPAASDPEGLCGCFYDAVAANLTFDEFVQLDASLDEPGAELPEDVQTFVQPCVDQFA